MDKQLEIYQWLGPIIAIYYIIRTFRQYKAGKYSPRNTIIWTIFWLGIMLLALLPDTVANSIARTFGFKDHINAIIFVFLALLILMVFYLSAALNRVENKMTELVRRIALDQAEQVKRDKSSQKNTPPKVAKKYISKKRNRK